MGENQRIELLYKEIDDLEKRVDLLQEKVLELESNIKVLRAELEPLQSFFKVAGGVLITAVFGAILALVIRNNG